MLDGEPQKTGAGCVLSSEQKLQLVVHANSVVGGAGLVWCMLVCALPRASRHTARGRLPGGGVPDVQVVPLLVLHLALVLHPPLLEGNLDLLGGAVPDVVTALVLEGEHLLGEVFGRVGGQNQE